jgi:hypothetical protein
MALEILFRYPITKEVTQWNIFKELLCQGDGPLVNPNPLMFMDFTAFLNVTFPSPLYVCGGGAVVNYLGHLNIVDNSGY